MATTSGLQRRRGAGPRTESGAFDPNPSGTVASTSNAHSPSSSRPSTPAAGTSTGPGLPTGGHHKVAYDARDLGDEEEDRKLPRLTLMEEVLLLGLKDKQARSLLPPPPKGRDQHILFAANHGRSETCARARRSAVRTYDRRRQREQTIDSRSVTDYA